MTARGRGFVISSRAPLRKGGRPGLTGRPVNPLSKVVLLVLLVLVLVVTMAEGRPT